MSEKSLAGIPEDGQAGLPRPGAHPELQIYEVFMNVEGLRVRVPRPLLGFIPFAVSKRFGFYVVMMLAAPGSSEPVLLLNLAKAALAEEFASISRSSPSQWQIKQVNYRKLGAAPAKFQQAGCVDQDWGAVWYELGDESAKAERYALAKKRLWEEGFTVTRVPSAPM